MGKAALLSVYDKTGIVEFAQVLHRAGYTILTSGGTGTHLAEAGIPIQSIETYTGQKEILGGRVKTLHPKIHGGILARRDTPKDLADLSDGAIDLIDVVVVNLYPFVKHLGTESAQNPLAMVELVDVGGPTMIRAAAKNHRFVVPVIDPRDYGELSEHIARDGDTRSISAERRVALATKVFAEVARYDSEVARYFSGVTVSHGQYQAPVGVAPRPVEGVVLTKVQDLRYGENPQQKAALYTSGSGHRSWEQLHGKELSYNNLLDFSAALTLIRSFPTTQPTCAIVKHLNPCGVATDTSLFTALRKAKLCDPRSHFGGILSFNGTVTKVVADEIREGFAEIVLAPDFAPDALDALKKSKNLRIVRVDLSAPPAQGEIRNVEGGYLVQEPDARVSDIREAEVVSAQKPSPEEIRDLQFAWEVCRHVKSNAIVVARDSMLLGVGGGQMSRIDSVELALAKAKTHTHSLSNSVAASDAFFPFPDSVQALAGAGVTAIVAPRGAQRDNESIEAANVAGICLLFTEDRHFRH